VFVIPSQIAKDLVELTQTNRKGVEALFEAESDLAQFESDLDRCEAQQFLDATGSVLNGRLGRSLSVLTYGLTVTLLRLG
jgi:hypothetical protein